MDNHSGGDSADVAYSVAICMNGDVVMGGYTESYGPDRVMYMVRLNQAAT